MNAPEPIAVAAAAAMLPMAQIALSKTNPRKNFDKAAMDELTQSIKQHGVLQPILARPVNGNGHYELVAGERRYRAAKAAGLADIPALVRELTDEQALEMQVIENLQRADLHPLEEAEGYEQLVKKHGHTPEELGAKIGKSKAYVYGRMKLCSLVPASRDLFYAGKFSASTALLIARVPVPDLQAKAAKEIAGGRAYGSHDALSYREAADHLQRHYMLRLADAPFKPADATLLPKIGACGPCPKRTGNQPELFEDVKGADVCTDPICFGAKRDAHFKRVREEAEVQNRKIISGKAAKELYPYGEHNAPRGHIEPSGKLNYGDKKTVAQYAKQVGIEPVLVEKPSTKELIEVYNEPVLKTALRKAGIIKDQEGKSKKQRENERAEKQKAKIAEAFRWRVFESLRGRLVAEPAVSTEDGVLVALTLWERADFAMKEKIVALYGWQEKPSDEKKKLRTADSWETVHQAEKRIAAMTAAELWRLMIELSVIEGVRISYGEDDSGKQLLAAAKRHGVNVEQLRKDVAGEIAPKAAPKKKATKAKKAAA